MSRALLYVNVLLALLDADHVDHPRARRWLETEIDDGWASCAPDALVAEHRRSARRARA